MRKKRNCPKAGDIFLIKLNEKEYGYGQFITGDLIGCYIFFDIIAESPPRFAEITNSSILFLTFTGCNRIVAGEWKIIGNNLVIEGLTIPEK